MSTGYTQLVVIFQHRSRVSSHVCLQKRPRSRVSMHSPTHEPCSGRPVISQPCASITLSILACNLHMVGVGGRSKACDHCKRRRVKCGRSAPSCALRISIACVDVIRPCDAAMRKMHQSAITVRWPSRHCDYPVWSGPIDPIRRSCSCTFLCAQGHRRCASERAAAYSWNPSGAFGLS